LFIALAQVCKGDLDRACEIAAELRRQIVDLILERQLGEHADGRGRAQPLLQRHQIEGGRRRCGARRCGPRFARRGGRGDWNRRRRVRGNAPQFGARHLRG
jgi:hypothetical protein